MSKPQRLLEVAALSSVEPREVDWLWSPFLPRGELVIGEGDGGVGKSLSASAVLSAISSGRGLPGMDAREPMNVLVLACEDCPERVLHKRFTMNGADLTRIHFNSEPFPLDPEGIKLLEQKIVDLGCGFVLIDPAVAYLPSGKDMNSAVDVRAMLGPLSQIAQKHSCTILIIRHFNKASQSGASHRGQGSVDWRNAARTVFQAIKTPSGTFLVLEKTNFGVPPQAIKFGINGGRVEWGETSSTTADQLHSDAREAMGDASELNEAIEFLKQELASGPCSSQVLTKSAHEIGISNATLRRAKKAISARSFKMPGDGKYMVEIPTGHVAQGAQAKTGEQVERDEQHDLFASHHAQVAQLAHASGVEQHDSLGLKVGQEVVVEGETVRICSFEQDGRIGVARDGEPFPRLVPAKLVSLLMARSS